MPVIWRQQMTTGNDLIDQDHKYLLSLFNSIELALSKPELLRYLPLFFQQLVDYTREHFAREEQIQLKVRYPGYMEHRRLHLRIIEKLEALNAKVGEELGTPTEDGVDDAGASALLKNDPEAMRQRLEAGVLVLAREWVIDHVVRADKLLQPYLKAYPRTFS